MRNHKPSASTEGCIHATVYPFPISWQPYSDSRVEQFSVPRIECPKGSSKKGSHVYFLLWVFWVILLFCQIVLSFDINVVLMLSWWPDVTIVQSDVTIVVPWQLSTGSKHDYLFCYCPLVGILFEVLRIDIDPVRK